MLGRDASEKMLNGDGGAVSGEEQATRRAGRGLCILTDLRGRFDEHRTRMKQPLAGTDEAGLTLSPRVCRSPSRGVGGAVAGAVGSCSRRGWA